MLERERLAINVLRECGVRAFGCYIAQFAYPGRAPAEWWGLEKPSGENLYLINVDVDEISLMSYFPFPVKNNDAYAGEAGGCWDWCTVPLEQSRRFQTIHERFDENQSWEYTNQYQIAKKTIKNGGSYWGCETFEELDARLDGFDSLYQDINDNGYKSAVQRFNEGSEWDECVTRIGDVYVPDELHVTIDRKGRVIRTTNGMHRLAMAKVLGVETIPSIVQFRHADWRGSLGEKRLAKESRLYRRVDNS